MSRRMSAPQITTEREEDDDCDTTDEAAEDTDNAAGKKAAKFPPSLRPSLERRLSAPHSMEYARPSDKPDGKELSAIEKRRLEERTRESSDFLARLRQLRVC